MKKNNEKRLFDNEKSNAITFHKRLPTLDQLKELLITEALKRANGNQSVAAQALGIPRQFVKKHNLNSRSTNGKSLIRN